MVRRFLGCFVPATLFFCFCIGVVRASDGEIIIGATLPLSGEFENYGQSAYYGISVRARMINDEGGVNGKKLRIIFRDNHGDSDHAKRDIVELVGQHNAVAIIGPLFSDAALAVRDLAREYRVVIVSPMASSEAITRDNPWIFRVGFTIKSESQGIVDFQMRAFGAKRCAAIYDPRHAFARELSDAVAEEFEERGGKVVGVYPMFNNLGEGDLVALLKRVAEGKPDFIFCASYALEATKIVQAARDADVGIRFCAPYTWDNELVFDGSGRRLAGTCITSSLFEKTFNYRPFQTFYNALSEAGMDNPDGQAANAYDAVSLVAKAMEKGQTSEDIRKGLLAIKRMPLATGRVSITPDRSALKSLIIRIVEIQGTRLVPVYAERFDPN